MGGGSKLSGAEVQRLQDALLAAFPTRSALAQMVRIGLDENLEAIAAQENLRTAVFELIRWAEAQGRIDDLIAAARTANQGNPELRVFGEDRQQQGLRINNPKNGDILAGETRISGIGPRNERVRLHFRRLNAEEFSYGRCTDTNSSGEWETIGPQGSWWRALAPGPYEMYACTADGRHRSPSINLFVRDTGNIVDITRGVGKKHNRIEILCELHTAFIEATRLIRGRPLFSKRASGPVDDVVTLAKASGDAIARELCSRISSSELVVRVRIDRSGRVALDPDTAWASYYAFPVPREEGAYGCTPGTNFASLLAMRQTQLAWRLVPHVSSIPSNPFARGFQVESAYLEIRHDGYRPEFIALTNSRAQSRVVTLSPVLHKRVAVLDFPGLGHHDDVPNFSQLIALEIVCAIEGQPSLAPFGYFSEVPRQADEPQDLFDEIGRPPVDIGNEVLRLYDIEAVQKQLELVDTAVVSGEGRHLQRKSLDIHYVVRGSYRLFAG